MTDIPNVSPQTFSSPDQLITELKHTLRKSPILLVIPAIAVGKPGLNGQYRDYLDAGARLFKELEKNELKAQIFALGARHRGDGFLHELGKEYLVSQHGIPNGVFAWNDEAFGKMGLCSVEEAQLLQQFLQNEKKNFLVITVISQSQWERYCLHYQGYGIDSVYLVIADKPDYHHLLHSDEEELLIQLTTRDPRWDSEIGEELREVAHLLRDADKPMPSPDYMRGLQERMLTYLKG